MKEENIIFIDQKQTSYIINIQASVYKQYILIIKIFDSKVLTIILSIVKSMKKTSINKEQ